MQLHYIPSRMKAVISIDRRKETGIHIYICIYNVNYRSSSMMDSTRNASHHHHACSSHTAREQHYVGLAPRTNLAMHSTEQTLPARGDRPADRPADRPIDRCKSGLGCLRDMAAGRVDILDADSAPLLLLLVLTLLSLRHPSNPAARARLHSLSTRRCPRRRTP